MADAERLVAVVKCQDELLKEAPALPLRQAAIPFHPPLQSATTYVFHDDGQAGSGQEHFFERHNVWVDECPMIEDLALHIFWMEAVSEGDQLDRHQLVRLRVFGLYHRTKRAWK